MTRQSSLAVTHDRLAQPNWPCSFAKMTDPLDALERLARLRDQGVLSDEEFAREKARILQGLAQTVAPPTAAGDRLGTFLRRLGSTKWVTAGLAAALVGGAVLAFFVWSDIDNASTREPSGNGTGRKVAGKSASVSPASPATVIRFEDSANCAPSEGLGEVIAQMKSAATVRNAAADSPIRLLGFQEMLSPDVKRSDSGSGPVTLVQIPVEGDWNGLRLRAVKTSIWGERDVSTLQLLFSDPAEQARSMLRQLGFKVGRVGELTAVDSPGGGYAMVGVEAVDGGSALTCARDERAGKAADEASASSPEG